MPKKVNHKPHNDGVAYFAKKGIIRDEKGIKIGERKEQVVNLLFSKVSVNEKDYGIAQAKSKKINLKIRVPYFKIESEYIVKINSTFDNKTDENEIFEIINIDEGSDKQLYLLLQKVKLYE